MVQVTAVLCNPVATLRADGVVVVNDHIPVDPVPPSLQVLRLACDAIIHHPHVLPRVNAENRLNVHGAGSDVLLVSRVGAHRAGVLVAEGGVGGVRGHVDGLAARVGGRVGGPSIVGAENVHHTLALQVLSEPDETWAEHGVCRREEVELEGFDGRAGFADLVREGLGNLGGSRRLQKSC